ncbi:Hsp20/alpha crystallin family protein [Oenococcus kitaharae]|uniref:Heat shock protein Hsp20 n=1 Tax=Oenococcus kitaharae DSM 17330 TaxID=1045004 RepID=G9WHY2_9LACO|nr:Hsp20/alpha crystallin family protein [Oenococcus kitaharae]EHN58867.1 heat shock protein Hsp20 [Oenococcus kitaharae DSM 17330]OEY81805.1 heat-shock protein Hsp20 [Oenococcus kitaharae]OEY84036.1 heat-shock protein Hsp20 [Oenococcus kitaharae]OEY85606.1 heat-shock protein Hsp20 [Oenococcus kitaharae]
MANDLIDRNDGLMDVGDMMGNLMNNFFGPRDEFWNGMRRSNPLMRTDISEDDKAYALQIELPGLDKKDIKIDYANNNLSVSGTLNRDSEQRDKKNHLVASERRSGSYSRSYYLPGVDESKISAKYEDGILKLVLPKSDENQAHHIEIQ